MQTAKICHTFVPYFSLDLLWFSLFQFVAIDGQTEGWFKLDPGEKGVTGTSERTVLYYYGEILGSGDGLDRTPR